MLPKKAYMRENINILNEFHLGMFEYEGLPDTIKTNFLEYWLQKFGYAAIRRSQKEDVIGFPKGSLIATKCQLANTPDPYGHGTNAVSTTLNGDLLKIPVDSPDIVVGINNFAEVGCIDVLSDAERLADIDISLDFLIFWTRLSPLLKVADEKTKKDVISAFSNIKKGIPVTIVTKKILEDLGVGSDGVSSEMLTAPDFADKIQYTARLREDILRWHYTRYGQVIQGDTKLAQQSVDEVNGTVSSSLIIPLNMLKCREKMIAEINKKFGLNASVRLSGAWRAEVTKYENETGEPDIDNSGEPEPEASEDPGSSRNLSEEKEEVTDDV